MQSRISKVQSRVTCPPRAAGLLAILGRNALGLRSSVASTASLRIASFSTLLLQLVQWHPSQYVPEAKHSQYLRRSR